MRTFALLFLVLLISTAERAIMVETVARQTANGTVYVVYNDENLVVSKRGALIKAKLAKGYTVEEAKDLRPLDGTCPGRAYEVSYPSLIVKAGSLISFYPEGSKHIQGTIESIVLGNDRPITVRSWGFPNGVTFPDKTEITFYSYSYCSEGNECVAPDGDWYFQTKVYKATLGADFNLPDVGLVKKGTTVILGSRSRTGCATNQTYDGQILIEENHQSTATSTNNSQPTERIGWVMLEVKTQSYVWHGYSYSLDMNKRGCNKSSAEESEECLRNWVISKTNNLYHGDPIIKINVHVVNAQNKFYTTVEEANNEKLKELKTDQEVNVTYLKGVKIIAPVGIVDFDKLD